MDKEPIRVGDTVVLHVKVIELDDEDDGIIYEINGDRVFAPHDDIVEVIHRKIKVGDKISAIDSGLTPPVGIVLAAFEFEGKDYLTYKFPQGYKPSTGLASSYRRVV